RVGSLDELFEAAETLASVPLPRGDRLAIVTNSHAAGLLAADALAIAGGQVASLAPATAQTLGDVLPRAGQPANPPDLPGDADPERYRRALAPVLADPGVDAALVMHCPSAFVPGVEVAAVTAAAGHARRGMPVLTSWLGGRAAEDGRRRLTEEHIPTYATPG